MGKKWTYHENGFTLNVLAKEIISITCSIVRFTSMTADFYIKAKLSLGKVR